MTKKTCETCFHEKTASDAAPCNTCEMNFDTNELTNWAAKSEVFWASDMVNKPKHYQLFPEKGIEVRDLVKVLAQKIDKADSSDFVSFKGERLFTSMMVSDYIQAMQYFLRFMDKGGQQDLEKGVWYMQKVIEAWTD